MYCWMFWQSFFKKTSYHPNMKIHFNWSTKPSARDTALAPQGYTVQKMKVNYVPQSRRAISIHGLVQSNTTYRILLKNKSNTTYASILAENWWEVHGKVLSLGLKFMWEVSVLCLWSRVKLNIRLESKHHTPQAGHDVTFAYISTVQLWSNGSQRLRVIWGLQSDKCHLSLCQWHVDPTNRLFPPSLPVVFSMAAEDDRALGVPCRQGCTGVRLAGGRWGVPRLWPPASRACRVCMPRPPWRGSRTSSATCSSMGRCRRRDLAAEDLRRRDLALRHTWSQGACAEHVISLNAHAIGLHVTAMRNSPLSDYETSPGRPAPAPRPSTRCGSNLAWLGVVLGPSFPFSRSLRWAARGMSLGMGRRDRSPRAVHGFAVASLFSCVQAVRTLFSTASL